MRPYLLLGVSFLIVFFNIGNAGIEFLMILNVEHVEMVLEFDFIPLVSYLIPKLPDANFFITKSCIQLEKLN